MKSYPDDGKFLLFKFSLSNIPWSRWNIDRKSKMTTSPVSPYVTPSFTFSHNSFLSSFFGEIIKFISLYIFPLTDRKTFLKSCESFPFPFRKTSIWSSLEPDKLGILRPTVSQAGHFFCQGCNLSAFFPLYSCGPLIELL